MYRLSLVSQYPAVGKSSFLCLQCLQKQSERFVSGQSFDASAALSTQAKSNSEWNQPQGKHTGIRIYNSLTKRKDDLILPRGNHLSWYVCGPTVYDAAHIGHASNYVRFDIIRRILLNFFDINVTYLMGITDIDDKIINKANELGEEFKSITSHYEHEFFHEMECLNIMQPTLTSRVTDNIPDILHFIQAIIDRGHAYQGSDGSMYFDVAKYGMYNKLHSQPAAEGPCMSPGVKRNLNDFALWKAVKPGEPFWASPWGDGRPGWHIECSTMASRVFGSALDIHSGGADLKFPHHENEIAQSCSFHNTSQWANYWMHTGFLHLQADPEKMSKSLKNTISTSELLSNYTANQFRMFCMMTDYRNNIEFNEDKMTQACALDKRVGSFLRQCEAYIKGQIVCGPISEAEIMQRLAETDEEVMLHLRDDFSTASAMKSLFDLIATVNVSFTQTGTTSTSRSPGVVAAVQLYVKRLCKKLGFHKKSWRLMQNEDSWRLKEVLDHTVNFRHQVRSFALNAELPKIDEALTSKEQKKARNQLFSPLLEGCDNFRTQLSHCKVSVQDLKTSSTWELDCSGHTSGESSWEESDNENLRKSAGNLHTKTESKQKKTSKKSQSEQLTQNGN